MFKTVKPGVLKLECDGCGKDVLPKPIEVIKAGSLTKWMEIKQWHKDLIGGIYHIYCTSCLVLT